MARAKFDSICKKLISDIGNQILFYTQSPFPLDPQALVETVTGYKSESESLKFTIDVAWLKPISKAGFASPWIKDLISDVVVAWEVDAGLGHKAIRSSVDNLDGMLGFSSLSSRLNHTMKGRRKRFDVRRTGCP
jgi:hypothetical protein